MPFYYILSIFMGLFLQACQPAANSQLQDDVKDLPGEIPSMGRSLFDQITMLRQENELVQVIPFPFQDLRLLLESRIKAPLTATLIPKGRSLQRHATEEPFRFPRVILAATNEGKNSPDELGFLAKDRLYLGYVEAAKQLEVISYNPDMGRFEYQIIDNYGVGLKPRVRYASRAFCLACHQNQAPIFSSPGWDETAANPKIQEQLKKAIKADSYMGIALQQLKNIPNTIDDSTDRANFMIPFQKIWSDGCDMQEQASTIHCRRLSTELALNYRIFDEFDENLYASAKVLYEKSWQKNFPSGLKIPGNNIPNYDPFKHFSGAKDLTFLNNLGLEAKEQILSLADDKDIPAELEPLKERSEAIETWTLENDGPARLIFAIASELQNADVLWLKKRISNAKQLSKILDQIELQVPTLLSDRIFTRCKTLEALASVLGESLPACDFRDFSAMPAAKSTGQNVDKIQKDPRLELLQKYCSQCHGSGPLNFLEGTDADVLRNLAADADKHLDRLMWELTRSRSMPPENSEQRKALENSPADRQAIIEILQRLKLNH